MGKIKHFKEMKLSKTLDKFIDAVQQPEKPTEKGTKRTDRKQRL